MIPDRFNSSDSPNMLVERVKFTTRMLMCNTSRKRKTCLVSCTCVTILFNRIQIFKPFTLEVSLQMILNCFQNTQFRQLCNSSWLQGALYT